MIEFDPKGPSPYRVSEGIHELNFVAPEDGVYQFGRDVFLMKKGDSVKVSRPESALAGQTVSFTPSSEHERLQREREEGHRELDSQADGSEQAKD